MLTFEDYNGLVIYPAHQIAALTPFTHGLVRGVTQDGQVLHRVGFPDPGHWARQGPSLVRPSLLQDNRDPAGFHHPGQPEGTEAPPPPHDARQILTPEGWHSDDGLQPADFQQALQDPALIRIHDDLYAVKSRLRRLDLNHRLTLDNGRQVAQLSRYLAGQLRRRLGHADIQMPGFHQYQLRDWPQELNQTDGEQLRAWFSQPETLMGNLFLQTVRFPNPDYGHDHRGYWYDPVSSCLMRAEFIHEPQLRYHSKSKACEAYHLMLHRIIFDLRLFNFQDLHFNDPGRRLLGSHVVLLTEKGCLNDYAEQIHRRFGFTILISGGSSKLIDAEFLARALHQEGIDQIILLAFVDWDPAGRDLAEAFIPQLQRYEIQVVRGPHIVVTPECFTEKEISLHSYPAPASTPALKTQARRWMEKGGGINGRVRGIGADKLKPLDRILQRLEQMGW
ncbi:MAG: hypothetical protein KF760_26990 [Candidatus Eremiobacteraeota bacterium]|nr:hypothetical protein [Candidatus Eremiobacteraeota bacterium]MCW5869613.1 hypothetical protein [Candidatus Eremiobacteraeota bacterium]